MHHGDYRAAFNMARQLCATSVLNPEGRKAVRERVAAGKEFPINNGRTELMYLIPILPKFSHKYDSHTNNSKDILKYIINMCAHHLNGYQEWIWRFGAIS